MMIGTFAESNPEKRLHGKSWALPAVYLFCGVAWLKSYRPDFAMELSFEVNTS